MQSSPNSLDDNQQQMTTFRFAVPAELMPGIATIIITRPDSEKTGTKPCQAFLCHAADCRTLPQSELIHLFQLHIMVTAKKTLYRLYKIDEQGTEVQGQWTATLSDALIAYAVASPSWGVPPSIDELVQPHLKAFLQACMELISGNVDTFWAQFNQFGQPNVFPQQVIASPEYATDDDNADIPAPAPAGQGFMEYFGTNSFGHVCKEAEVDKLVEECNVAGLYQ